VGWKRLTNMGVLTLCILVIFTSDLMTAKPVQNSIDETSSGHLSGLPDYQRMNTFLTNYVESKFPHLDKRQQSRMKVILVNRFRMKIMEENLTRPWYGNNDTFARMLK
jgi:hypothetical protein